LAVLRLITSSNRAEALYLPGSCNVRSRFSFPGLPERELRRQREAERHAERRPTSNEAHFGCIPLRFRRPRQRQQRGKQREEGCHGEAEAVHQAPIL
jgi:hypothetical protein